MNLVVFRATAVRLVGAALAVLVAGACFFVVSGRICRAAANAPPDAKAEPSFPPRLPDGKALATDCSPEMLRPPETILPDVEIASRPPTVDFMFYPGQDYPGNPWSNWGDGVFAAGKYYSSIGDHLAPHGNAMVFEYDPAAKKLRKLIDLKSLLKVPDGQYAPSKIHTRLDMGKDGWLYFATHRGSPKATTDQFGYKGDWIVRVQPASGKAEIVAHAPLAKHSIPTGITDTQRLIFYGGTAPGADAPQQSICFFAYDLAARRLLYAGADGPARAIILASSTGKAYYWPGQTGMRGGKLLRFDPASGKPPEPVADSPGIRAATAETPQGKVYAVSTGQGGDEPILWAFDVKTERIEQLGTARVGSQSYITSIDADPTGRYLYYVPGAHGGSQRDGAAVVRFDTQTRKKRIVAFLHPFYQQRYGVTLCGTYSTAVDSDGRKLYITWNASRGSRAWDCCCLTVVHLPPED